MWARLWERWDRGWRENIICWLTPNVQSSQNWVRLKTVNRRLIWGLPHGLWGPRYLSCHLPFPWRELTGSCVRSNTQELRGGKMIRDLCDCCKNGSKDQAKIFFYIWRWTDGQAWRDVIFLFFYCYYFPGFGFVDIGIPSLPPLPTPPNASSSFSILPHWRYRKWEVYNGD